MLNLLRTILVLLIILPAAALAGFEEGREAFIKGDWQTVKSEMLPLAQEGDAKAQIAMGLLYARGDGVVQDWDLAAYWFAIATEFARFMEDRAEGTVVRILAHENHSFSLKRATKIVPNQE
ncbi:MAG: hypothetical protein CMM76_06925 [Rhodospirillaceae bacterium]|nr:hypothetical protein [Rhodospirillaceae bacterium]|tara:strand:+ start:60 stop:422 length:363 start_codon:yes stop_codon:yes gene_type:complete